MTSKVVARSDTAGLKALQSVVGGTGMITVGVHGTEGSQTYADGPTIVEIAEAAEFGLGQPERSWLRAWYDENLSQIESVLESQLRLALEKKETFEWAAERVALWMQADIQRRIRNRIDPPNSAITIANKGSDTPLIDTGVFRSAILAYYNGNAVRS